MKIKYFLYARKSSESEDRQVQSLDDQINQLTKLAKQLGLDVVKTYTEAKSAKKPDNRPLFDEMMSRIESNEANGILCWQLNRLSRNPIDSGKISWLLQQNIIKSIQTIEKEYLPDDNVLLFSVETGMANQYIIDLRKNVRRGTLSKIDKGWAPYMPPLGYLNEKNDRTIVKDSERYDLVRKMWDLLLTGIYNPRRILKIANKEWGFRTRRFKKIGGCELSMSGIYKIFNNPFYAGTITYAGKEYQGKHDKMITFNEYDRVQAILGRKDKPRPKKHYFAFTGLIKCDECGCFYTADIHKKYIKSDNSIREHTYYHCTRKKTYIDCTQRKGIPEGNLKTQLEREIYKYKILPDFRDLAFEILDEQSEEDIEQVKVVESRQNALAQVQNELSELTRMRYRNLIDDTQFLKEKEILENGIKQFEKELTKTDSPEEKLELTKNKFNYIVHAHQKFLSNNPDDQKEVVNTLFSDIKARDRALTLTAHEWLIPIGNGYPELKRKFLELEPYKNGFTKEQNEAFASLRSRWSAH